MSSLTLHFGVRLHLLIVPSCGVKIRLFHLVLGYRVRPWWGNLIWCRGREVVLDWLCDECEELTCHLVSLGERLDEERVGREDPKCNTP